MTGFSDQLMIHYLDPANVNSLLVPAADATRQRAQALLASVYQPRLLTVESVDSVTVTAQRFQVPLTEPVRVDGTWEKILPVAEQSRFGFEVPNAPQQDWIDMLLETTVSVRVAATSGPLDEIASEDVSELPEQEFLAKFQFLDLAALMKSANLTTYQQLQAEFPRLYHLNYAAPAAFDPGDPGAVRTYKLLVSVLFFAQLDAAGALRQIVQSRRALDAARPRPSEYEGGDVLGASAWIGVFPASAFNTAVSPVTQDQLSALFTAAGCVAAVENL
jgi:hypothetical protein